MLRIARTSPNFLLNLQLNHQSTLSTGNTTFNKAHDNSFNQCIILTFHRRTRSPHSLDPYQKLAHVPTTITATVATTTNKCTMLPLLSSSSVVVDTTVATVTSSA